MLARRTIAVALLLTLTLPLPGQTRQTAVPPPPGQAAQPAAQVVGELEGKTLAQWTQDLKHADPSVREHALVALAYFGPPAGAPEIISLVIDRTKDIDASPKVRAVIILSMYLEIRPTDVSRVVNALTARLDDQQSQVRYYAAVGLHRFGEESRSAIAALAKYSDDQTTFEIRKMCLSALALAGQNGKAAPDVRAVSAMVKAAKDHNGEVRLEVAMGLGMLGKTGDRNLAPLVDQVLRNLGRDSDKRVAVWAHVSQMALDNKVNDVAVLDIAHQLRAHDMMVRLHASRALGAMGPKAKVALDSLLNALDDREPTVVQSVIYTLVQMEDRSPKVLTALADLGQRKEAPEAVRQAAQVAVTALKRGMK